MLGIAWEFSILLVERAAGRMMSGNELSCIKHTHKKERNLNRIDSSSGYLLPFY